MISKTGSLDQSQKQMLVQAQEKRLAAQGIISQSYGELLQVLTSGFGDLVKMTAPLPALQQANNSLIQSCIISAKWEQAMRAKDVPQADKKKAELLVSDLNSKYKD
jgi:DNA-binding protein YbaB